MQSQNITISSMIPIVNLSRNELREKIFDNYSKQFKIPIFKNNGNQDVFKGFYYFSPDYFFGEFVKPRRFLVAYNYKTQDSKEIIGILKFGLSNDYKTLPYHCIIDWVDVREDKRRGEVATSLFKKLNEVLTPNDFLVGTPLSEIGERSRLNEKLHNIISVCPYFDDLIHFDVYCKKNNLRRVENVK